MNVEKNMSEKNNRFRKEAICLGITNELDITCYCFFRRKGISLFDLASMYVDALKREALNLGITNEEDFLSYVEKRRKGATILDLSPYYSEPTPSEDLFGTDTMATLDEFLNLVNSEYGNDKMPSVGRHK